MSGLVLLMLFLLCLALGVPIVASMGCSALIFMLIYMQTSPLIIMQQMMSAVDKYTLLAIPFFIIAGVLMETGGITKRLIVFCNKLLGSVPGGLALVCIFSSIIFAAMTGSGAATCAALGSILIPAMIAEGYGEDFACALQATGGLFGPLIPPSILAVLYAVSSNISVTDILMGGLLPGVMMGLMIAAVTYVICVKRNYRGKGHFSLKELGKSFVDAIWALLTPIIILGGIYSGFFTPTEAAAIGAFYAMLVGLFVYREMTLKSLVSAMTKAIRATAVIMLIVTTAQAFTWVMTRAMIPQKLSEVFINISSNPTVFMFVIAVLLLFLGCFLDGVAAIVILAPILAEAANGYGINPIHFGVVVITGLVLGLVTPPVGANLFVVSSVANRPIFKFVPELVPFFITAVIGYVLIILFPQLSTLIPTMLQK